MTMRPVSAGERIEVLDALRGAALFGIIAANMRGFSGPLAAYFDHTLMWTDPVNRIAQAFVDLFIQGKFITLFAFMFGIGFAIQMERADRSGIASRIFYVRRLAILLLFGALHFVFVWWGDILAPYALMGFRADAVPQAIAEGALAMVGGAVCLAAPARRPLMFVAHSAGAPDSSRRRRRRLKNCSASSACTATAATPTSSGRTSKSCRSCSSGSSFSIRASSACFCSGCGCGARESFAICRRRPSCCAAARSTACGSACCSTRSRWR